MKENAGNCTNAYKIKTFFVSVLILIIVSVIIFSISAFLMTKTDFSDGIINILSYLSVIVSVIIAAIYFAYKIGNKGLFYGLIFGAFYSVVWFIARKIVFPQTPYDAKAFLTILFGLLSGMTGGIIGVNMRFRRR